MGSIVSGCSPPYTRRAATVGVRLAFLTPLLLLLATMFLQPIRADAQESASRILVVGTKDAPPFAIKNPNGTWSGISVDLWRQIARQLSVDTRFLETDLKGLFTGVHDGRFDAAVAAITITTEREREFDFSHAIYTTGLAIAARNEGAGWLHALRRFVSPAFLKVILALLGILFSVGLATWLFERKRNPAQFSKKPLTGIGGGFWWAAVTMTTVGYGDKAPVSLGGRIVALIWMFTAIIIISGFTAAITTALTVSQLDTAIRGPDDLRQVRVATIPGTTSEIYLKRNHIVYRETPSLDVALQALVDRQIDAVVYDAPMLKYRINQRQDKSLTILPYVFERQDYAILLPAGSELREPINQILLDQIQTRWWEETVEKYLGR